jgi:putative hydrolase of the HAD superfamily
MTISVIAFDADDTLWDYEIIYEQARPEILRLLGSHQENDELSAILDETEINNLVVYGYGVKSFALSMIEMFANHANGPIDKTTLKELIVLFKYMLSKPLEVNQYAESVLNRLSKEYCLMLLTKGELFEQERKIQRSGLEKYFDIIEITSQKTEKKYRQILEKHGIKPHQFLMVGNSLKSDILPVIGIGGRAVYIPHPQTWIYETLPEEEQGGGYSQLDHLGQLPEYLDQMGVFSS